MGALVTIPVPPGKTRDPLRLCQLSQQPGAGETPWAGGIGADFAPGLDCCIASVFFYLSTLSVACPRPLDHIFLSVSRGLGDTASSSCRAICCDASTPPTNLLS